MKHVVALLSFASATSGCFWAGPSTPNHHDTEITEGDAAAVNAQSTLCEQALEGLDVDVLFVIDDSQSMGEEQESLAREIPKLVRSLARGVVPGEEDRDGVVPARSIHVGVVSSDMGINGVPDIGNCRGFGRDGMLLQAEGCGGPQGFVEYEPDATGAGDADFAAEVACLTQLGTQGCGFEQPLEAMWKALSPSADQSFSRETSGHGNAENAGFLRPDSLLVVVLLSDEDDCSVPDSSRELFASELGEMNINVKCGRNPELTHPISRYAQGLRSLREHAPERLLFVAIGGVPTELEGQDYASILAAEAMQFAEEMDPVIGLVPKASCSSEGGVAYPPRRALALAQELGPQSLVRSICREDFGGTMDSVTGAIKTRMQASALACQ